MRNKKEHMFHCAIEYNDIDTIKRLIERGVNLKHRHKESKSTFLHIAIARKRINIIKILLKQGVDLSAKDIFKDTPMTLAEHIKTVNAENRGRETPLHLKIIKLLRKYETI